MIKFVYVHTFSFHNGLPSTYGSLVPSKSSPLPCYVLRFLLMWLLLLYYYYYYYYYYLVILYTIFCYIIVVKIL